MWDVAENIQPFRIFQEIYFVILHSKNTIKNSNKESIWQSNW